MRSEKVSGYFSMMQKMHHVARMHMHMHKHNAAGKRVETIGGKGLIFPGINEETTTISGTCINIWWKTQSSGRSTMLL